MLTVFVMSCIGEPTPIPIKPRILVHFGVVERKKQADNPGGRMLSVFWWIIVGLIAGWATGKIMRGSSRGFMGDIAIGIVGAIVGGEIMRLLGFERHGGMIYTILVAIGGAVILTFLYRLITGGRGRGGGDTGLRRAA